MYFLHIIILCFYITELKFLKLLQLLVKFTDDRFEIKFAFEKYKLKHVRKCSHGLSHLALRSVVTTIGFHHKFSKDLQSIMISLF